MDLLQSNDFDRHVLFENARKTAETEYARNPNDADNLTRWGGALLELSQFNNGPECEEMIKEAVAKLEEALVVNPRKHDALWCLGNAYTSHAFLLTEQEAAKVYFDRAFGCFKQAAEEDPGNALYIKSLEMTAKIPDLHLELQRQAMSQQQASSAGTSSTASVKKQAPKKKNSDLKYDVCGWIILAIGMVAWVGMAKSHHIPPPPQR